MSGGCLWLGDRRCLRSVIGVVGRSVLDQLTRASEVLSTVALGQKAVATNAVEAVGQNMEEKAADELVWGKAHDAAPSAAAIVLVGEGHLIVVDGDEARIGDGRAMRVAREVGQHPLGSAEGRLGVDDEGGFCGACAGARRKRRP